MPKKGQNHHLYLKIIAATKDANSQFAGEIENFYTGNEAIIRDMLEKYASKIEKLRRE